MTKTEQLISMSSYRIGWIVSVNNIVIVSSCSLWIDSNWVASQTYFFFLQDKNLKLILFFFSYIFSGSTTGWDETRRHSTWHAGNVLFNILLIGNINISLHNLKLHCCLRKRDLWWYNIKYCSFEDELYWIDNSIDLK